MSSAFPDILCVNIPEIDMIILNCTLQCLHCILQCPIHSTNSYSLIPKYNYKHSISMKTKTGQNSLSCLTDLFLKKIVQFVVNSLPLTRFTSR